MTAENLNIKDNKSELFSSLLNSVEYCDICPRMCERNKVLSDFNGTVFSKVMFIAEAPGRLGAECTKIPLYGDRTGDNFETLLNNIGWSRKDVFITNAILCNPQDENGNNSTPTNEELENCSEYLSMTINLIAPEIIVTLGVKALEALKSIHPHNYVLNRDVAECVSWNERTLFPLYHTGPRALIHRSLPKQRGDFIKLSHIVDPKKGLKKKVNTHPTAVQPASLENTVNKRISDVLLYTVNIANMITMFKATKLMYLADLDALEKTGDTITQSIYLRMQEGPWIPNLKQVAEELKNAQAIKVTFRNRKPVYTAKGGNAAQSNLSAEHQSIIKGIIAKYESFDDARIKTAVYLTKPMKYILKQENAGKSMIKVPVIYQNRTVIELDKVDE